MWYCPAQSRAHLLLLIKPWELKIGNPLIFLEKKKLTLNGLLCCPFVKFSWVMLELFEKSHLPKRNVTFLSFCFGSSLPRRQQSGPLKQLRSKVLGSSPDIEEEPYGIFLHVLMDDQSQGSIIRILASRSTQPKTGRPPPIWAIIEIGWKSSPSWFVQKCIINAMMMMMPRAKLIRNRASCRSMINRFNTNYLQFRW